MQNLPPFSRPHSLLTRLQAAQQLTVSIRTIDARLAAGELPHVRLGHLIRFKEEDLAAYIAAHRVPSRYEVAR